VTGGREYRVELASGGSGSAMDGDRRLSREEIDSLRLSILEEKSERKSDKAHDSRHWSCWCRL